MSFHPLGVNTSWFLTARSVNGASDSLHWFIQSFCWFSVSRQRKCAFTSLCDLVPLIGFTLSPGAGVHFILCMFYTVCVCGGVCVFPESECVHAEECVCVCHSFSRRMSNESALVCVCATSSWQQRRANAPTV